MVELDHDVEVAYVAQHERPYNIVDQSITSVWLNQKVQEHHLRSTLGSVRIDVIVITYAVVVLRPECECVTQQRLKP